MNSASVSTLQPQNEFERENDENYVVYDDDNSDNNNALGKKKEEKLG